VTSFRSSRLTEHHRQSAPAPAHAANGGAKVVGLLALHAVVGALFAPSMPAASSAAGPFDGTWTLAPAYSTTCTAGPQSVLVTVGRVYTRQTAPDSLTITSDVAVTGPGITHLDIYGLVVHLDSAAGKFAFSGPVKGAVERNGYSGMLSGTLRLRGAFQGADHIRATVRTTLTMSITGPGAVSSGTCATVNDTIIATRVTQ